MAPQDGSITLSQIVLNPITNQVEALIKVPPGVVKDMEIFSQSDLPGKVDIYFPAGTATYAPSLINRQGVVGSPGTMENAITVGSYDWNDNFHLGGSSQIMRGACSQEKSIMKIGSISCYSSPGPTRDGRMKPEIASPGQWFTSSAAMVDGVATKPDRLDSTGKYIPMNGTSAATPYTAGIVALMFEKKPTLTLGEVKNLLRTKATKDVMTGMNPNTGWGAGKLDYNAVARIISEIR